MAECGGKRSPSQQGSVAEITESVRAALRAKRFLDYGKEGNQELAKINELAAALV